MPDSQPPLQHEPSQPHDAPSRFLSGTQLYLFAVASAVVTANAYYIHPIIARVAADFGVSDTMIGLVPALNQIALALGIFLLLPLGDWISNKKLVSVFVAGQTIAIGLMAFATDYWLFVTGSTILGFFTIAPYLLPAYVSKRVEQTRLGLATAVLTTGIIGGILFARAGAGAIGEYVGWRAVYIVAGGLMLLFTFLLPTMMDEREKARDTTPDQTYFGLLGSIVSIIRTYPEILLSGTIQALGFGVFLSIWLGLGLHLTSPEMGYGVDIVGYLAIFSAISLATTPRLGAWADKIGARKARLYIATFQMFGVALFALFGNNLWLLLIPIVWTNIGGPMIDVSGRMTFLSEAEDVRTRLMTVYIVFMFVGGGMASWAGTATYDYFGWTGNGVLALSMSAMAVLLSYIGWRWKGRG